MIKTKFFATLCCVAASGLALGQSPTPQQLEALGDLAPGQVEALMQQAGIDPAAASTVTSPDAIGRPAAAEGASSSPTVRDAVAAQESSRLLFRDVVLIDISVRGEAQPGLAEFVERVQRRNPYRIDESGSLQLPGIAPVQIAGLTVAEATKRLSVVPALSGFQLGVTRLPVTPLGRGGVVLKPFGYDLFQRAPSTFAPVTDVPVPADYIVGPGDQINILLYGSRNRTLRLVVGRDGQLNFPELGPIAVAGKPFNAVREDIEARVASQLVGAQASVSMGDARAIRIFVTGEANQPGSYTVSGLATITSALYAAGGVRATGSLRNVQLKRQGAIVRRLDLYDLLLRGDTSGDASLLSGDVVFIPPVGETVTVDGEVLRPAIYEIDPQTTVAQVVALAGGLTNQADPTRVSVVRLDEQRRRVALDRPLSPEGSGRVDRARDGDVIEVARVRPTLDSGVRLEGHVYRPGTLAWREGLRISQVIADKDDLKPNADLRYVLVITETPEQQVSVGSVDLIAAWRSPGSREDLELGPRSRVIVFDADADRAPLLEPVLASIRRQGAPDRPSAVVTVGGAVRHPGQYPLEAGMRVSDLLRAGGALQDRAYNAAGELVRYSVVEAEQKTDVLIADLGAVIRGDSQFDAELQALDSLTVKEIKEFGTQQTVQLRGEVLFPGVYVIRPGETLRTLIERAGGLTSLAFPAGAVFTRAELRTLESERIASLTEQLQADLVISGLQAQSVAGQGRSGGDTATALALLRDLKNVKPLGRLVIDLSGVLSAAAGGDADIVLRSGDELVIPKFRQEVSVLGEVRNGTSHLFRSDLTQDDYIALSGGLTNRADKSGLYIVRADGSVVAGTRGLWRLGRGFGGIQPGDTIIAPPDTDRLPPLPLWQAVTSILYNSAVALAAIQTL